MTDRQHHYHTFVEWTGNRGSGTSGHREYGRDHVIVAAGKPSLLGSADPAFLGDGSRWNPEDLLVAATSACHQLWYLYFCAKEGIIVVGYSDDAEGILTEGDRGQFTQIILRPKVTIRWGDDGNLAASLHQKAHEKCFIANSLNCPVLIEPSIESADPSA